MKIYMLIDDEVLVVGVGTDVAERVVDDDDLINFEDVRYVTEYNDIADETDEQVLVDEVEVEVDIVRLEKALIIDAYLVEVWVECDTQALFLELKYITEVVEVDEVRDVCEIYQLFVVDDVEDVEGLDVTQTDEMQQLLEVDEVEYDVGGIMVVGERMVYSLQDTKQLVDIKFSEDVDIYVEIIQYIVSRVMDV